MNRTTKLEAVNEMLFTVGQAPVDSLSSGLYQAEQAETQLDHVTRAVQTAPWDFNREECYTLYPDSNGEILLPPNMASMDAVDPSIKVVQRGNKLYDKRNHTFVFTEPVDMDVQWMFAFEELPEAARQFIYLKAARRFQKLALGSDNLDNYTAEDEARALGVLKQYDSDTGDYNLFESNYDSAFIAYRNWGI